MKKLSTKKVLWTLVVGLGSLLLAGIAYRCYREHCINESIVRWEGFLRSQVRHGMGYLDAEKIMMGYIDRAEYETTGVYGDFIIYYQVDNEVEVGWYFDSLRGLSYTFVQRKGVWHIREGCTGLKQLNMLSSPPKTLKERIIDLLQRCKNLVQN